MPGTPHPDGRPEPGPDAPASKIQADIEQTRAELGDTAEALAGKLDVPRQAREKIAQTRQAAAPIAVGAATVLVVLAWRRRRRRRR